MEDLDQRYAGLVSALDRAASGGGSRRPLAELAADADRLAVGDGWRAAQARGLAAAFRLLGGGPAALALAVADVPPPVVDPRAVERLAALLPGDGPIRERLRVHGEASRVPPAAVGTAAGRLLRLLRSRAREDLDLPAGESVEIQLVSRPGESWHARSEADGPRTRLVLNEAVSWDADQLIRAIAGKAYPGRHLARVGRPAAVSWDPSPESTLLHGLAAAGREVILGDHELAFELERIGRAAGERWDGRQIVAVRRARDELAPAVASVALGSAGPAADRLAEVGVDAAILRRWERPLGRVVPVARAGGPPLVRAWLALTGQTAGLQRLVTERPVPSDLRRELAATDG